MPRLGQRLLALHQRPFRGQLAWARPQDSQFHGCLRSFLPHSCSVFVASPRTREAVEKPRSPVSQDQLCRAFLQEAFIRTASATVVIHRRQLWPRLGHSPLVQAQRPNPAGKQLPENWSVSLSPPACWILRFPQDGLHHEPPSHRWSSAQGSVWKMNNFCISCYFPKTAPALSCRSRSIRTRALTLPEVAV